jgi:outer membrane murein-binding lipoprotein Lpp
MKISRLRAAGAAVLVTVSLAGCAQAEQFRGQAEEITGQAEQLWTEARELGDLTVDQVQGFDWSSLAEYEGIFLGDNSKVTEFFRSMPSGPDMESFEIKGDEGKLVVHYGEQATEVDPAVLQETMEQVAAQAKERVQNLETVEFRVGDRTYTF